MIFIIILLQLSLDYYMRNVDAIKHFMQGEITKHRETYDANNTRDLVDLQAEKNDFKDMKGMDGMLSSVPQFVSGQNGGKYSVEMMLNCSRDCYKVNIAMNRAQMIEIDVNVPLD